MKLCSNCAHWEPKPGLKPEREGHCPIFTTATDAIHGERCTAWQGRDHGQAVENAMLAKHPDVI